jgi:hypothetical protein
VRAQRREIDVRSDQGGHHAEDRDEQEREVAQDPGDGGVPEEWHDELDQRGTGDALRLRRGAGHDPAA